MKTVISEILRKLSSILQFQKNITDSWNKAGRDPEEFIRIIKPVMQSIMFTKRLININQARDAIREGTGNEMELKVGPVGGVLKPVGKPSPFVVLKP